MTTERRTFCRVCNAMCGLVVTTEGDRVVRVRGDEDHPLSRGYSCAKGRALGDLHHDPNRLDHPYLGRPDARRAVSWDELLDDLTARLSSTLDAHGPDGIAMFLASGSAFDTAGRRTAERFLRMSGSRQKYTATTIDTPCKPLVAESMGGWSGLTPIWDELGSSLLVLVGSNPVVSHGHSNAIPDPVRRLREFRTRGGRLVVVDPRRTETASMADLHIRPRPGSDWALLAWTVRVLLDERPAPTRASGVGTLRAALDSLSLDDVASCTDLAPAAIHSFVDVVRSHERLSALTGTGCSMTVHADITEYLLWSLLVVTDSFDSPGGMWFNPGLLSGLDRRDLPVSDGRAGPGPPSAPHLPRRFDEWPCVGLLHEIEAGNIGTLLVVGGNPALAFPDTARTQRALASLDTLAVVDILPTATTALATHVLPAVDALERADLTWLLDTYQLAVAGQYTEAVVAPRAERRPVWWMFGSLGARLGLDVLPAAPDDLGEDELLAPLRRRSRVGDEPLRTQSSGVVASGPVHGWVSERVLPDGRWRLAPDDLVARLRRAVQDPTPTGDSLRLVPHRRLRMMNSQFEWLTDGTVDEIGVRVHPRTANDLGGEGTRVRVTTANGSTEGRIVVDDRLRIDTVAISHGSSTCNVSHLTSADDRIDPLAGMVEQGAIDCRLDRVVADADPG